MGSHGSELSKKTMWLYPKSLGCNPSERWGHSACSSNGVVYVFGGCCGGLHYSDVLTLDLHTMVWSSLSTTGQRPGTRDSHSSVLVDHKMVVMGGTNGFKKVNDLHILDLRTKEWSRPICEGNPPSPRESHSATVMGDRRLVVFGGSGEGEGNYLNDVHVLDLKTMQWTSPEVKGDVPPPRDSHAAVAICNKLIVYGGDCGDRYYGQVDVLDMDTLTWSRLAVKGSSPGVRAGHAAVTVGTKVYIIGGVGDKHYYNDVWVLDLSTCKWGLLDVCGQQPRGRFSHSAVAIESQIVIYGGCGEDERPVSELLLLRLGGRYDNPTQCKMLGSHWNQEKRRLLRGSELMEESVKTSNEKSDEVEEVRNPHSSMSDNMRMKRRRTCHPRVWDVEGEQEHSLSLSQQSSPSQSDHEQVPATKLASPPSSSPNHCCHLDFFKKHRQCNGDGTIQMEQRHQLLRRAGQKYPFTAEGHHGRPEREQFVRVVHGGRPEVRHFSPRAKAQPMQAIPALIGADVHGTVDGAFDSGYLMTANVNGQILRGVLFTPGPSVVTKAALPNTAAGGIPVALSQPHPASLGHPNAAPNRAQPKPILAGPPPGVQVRESPSSPVACVNLAKPAKAQQLPGDLQGVVLTLGGPGST